MKISNAQKAINQLRAEYIDSIQRKIDKFCDKNDFTYWHKIDLQDEIDRKFDDEAYQQIFNDAEQVYEMANVHDNEDANEIIQRATDIIENELFDNDKFSEYNFDNLPFVRTISITWNEDYLHSVIIENILLNDHIEVLEMQHSNILKKIQEKKDAVIEALKKDEITTLGYPKSLIVEDLNKLLKKSSATYGRANKIACAREVYHYLAKPYSKIFIENNNKFKLAVMNKLFEFRNVEDLKESRVWWRNIFGERMPVSNNVV